MPFVSAVRPSIQLGLLKAIGARHGYPVTTFHLNLEFAKQLGSNVYEVLCHHRGRLFGDWLFSLAAYGASAPDQGGDMLSAFPQELRPLKDIAGLDERGLEEIRRVEVPKYLSAMRESIDWRDFDVVGFTSTFQQTMASAAMARAIRDVHPGVKVVFGGANLDGCMGRELVNALPVVDYGVSGEADTAFPALLSALESGADPLSIPGLIGRRDGAIVANEPSPPFEAMDSLPPPDYDEYFARAQRLELLPDGGSRDVMLPFESSRGCWWGAKKHCSFCGLNGSTMKYRSKSPERVLDELQTLSRRYRTFSFEAVDNIMDHDYLKTLLPTLIEQGSSYNLFYEIKSNVGREEMRLMQQAGITKVQPGIESLSTPILRLMRKGVKASQNVNMLRWARYYGIRVAWNLLWGFPGERVEDYEAQASLMRSLVHLEPPLGCGPVWLERFSPLYRERGNFPIKRLEPESSYRYVYPGHVDLNAMAFFFDFELEQTLPSDSLDFVAHAADAWKRAWQGERPPSLQFFRVPGFLEIEDRRDAANIVTHSFQDALAEIYFAVTDHPRRVDAIKRELGLKHPLDELSEALEEFCRRGLMMKDDDSYLALALPAGGKR
jgi:ribosomal peptide maturation radical SAM protein 1